MLLSEMFKNTMVYRNSKYVSRYIFRLVGRKPMFLSTKLQEMMADFLPFQKMILTIS